MLSDATSYWPAWLENSWLILSRTSFSGSTVKFTPMPVSLVKFSAVSCCRSTIWGLLTISTLMVSGPPPPAPPPQPAEPPQAERPRAARVAAAIMDKRRVGRLVAMVTPRVEGGRRVALVPGAAL